jgi:hypothetical protein
MNRGITPYLLAALFVLGLLAVLSERPRRAASGASQAGTSEVLDVPRDNILRLRMKKDFWNSYVLTRDEGGQWGMEEPSRGPAVETEVRRLLETVTALPLLRTLDIPGDDAEKRREYGLWSPSLEITLSTPAGATTLLFGAHTPDETGVYVAVHGQPRVYVVPTSAFDVLQRDADTYRDSP